MHWPFWHAVPAPQAGLQASGTQVPSTQTFPAPQKSAQVALLEVEQAASPERSNAARRVVVRFKVGPFPDPQSRGPSPRRSAAHSKARRVPGAWGNSPTPERAREMGGMGQMPHVAGRGLVQGKRLAGNVN